MEEDAVVAAPEEEEEKPPSAFMALYNSFDADEAHTELLTAAIPAGNSQFLFQSRCFAMIHPRSCACSIGAPCRPGR